MEARPDSAGMACMNMNMNMNNDRVNMVVEALLHTSLTHTPNTPNTPVYSEDIPHIMHALTKYSCIDVLPDYMVLGEGSGIGIGIGSGIGSGSEDNNGNHVENSESQSQSESQGNTSDNTNATTNTSSNTTNNNNSISMVPTLVFVNTVAHADALHQALTSHPALISMLTPQSNTNTNTHTSNIYNTNMNVNDLIKVYHSELSVQDKKDTIESFRDEHGGACVLICTDSIAR